MTLAQELFDKASEYLPADRVSWVREAYEFAHEAHEGQIRKSGEPFIDHPLNTALYLAEMKLDSVALSAALLHDVLEDTDVGYERISDRFGEDVAKLVDGVTKLTRSEQEHGTDEETLTLPHDARAASIRKMLMTMAQDVRVVLIKLADRLHNMRTLGAMKEDRRLAIARETLDIYAPLAHRLGIWEIKWILEDLAFQHLNPDAYEEISQLLATKRDERERYIERIVGLLKEELATDGVEAQVTGRAKHIYSIYLKGQKYSRANRSIDEINDLFALRIIVSDIQECYGALGTVHAKWRPLPGEFDDYIANPKDNLYQSLHTAVLCEGGAPVEIQIRTREMHHLAEFGIAAHWLYKEGEASDVKFEEKMIWLRQILDWQRDVSGAEEFIEGFKTDVFENQVFVYTPRGDLKELPAGATPLDFAYRVHTEVGHRCIGAKVNGKLVPLQYKLQNGDTVEIMTSKTVRGPSRDWLNDNLQYLRTASAKSKVRQWFNRQERKANIQTGKEVFAKEVRRLDTEIMESGVADLMSFDNVDDFFCALGSGAVTIGSVVNKLTASEVQEKTDVSLAEVTLPDPTPGIQVLGVGDLLTRMARCCNPIGGDKITGYITRGRGVTVHRQTCPNVLRESEIERLVPVDWGEAKTLYPVRIRLEGWDRVGLLRDVTSQVSNEGVNITYCSTIPSEDSSVITLTVLVDSLDQLTKLFAKLEGVVGVMQVYRTTE